MDRKLTVFAIGAFAVCLVAPSRASAQVAPVLGNAKPYAVLGGSTVTNTGTTVVIGDLGVSPGSAVTGFPPGTVSGTIHSNDANAIAAQTDVTTAYNNLVGQATTSNLTGQDLGGKTLVAGVYQFDTSAQLTGTLTLTGNASSVWIFKIGSTLTTASASQVVITGGGSPCNVFWQVGSSATLGTTTSFQGNILALTSITLNTNASIVGRALARNGAVTLDTNAVNASGCTGLVACPAITLSPATLPNAVVGTAYSQTLTASGGAPPYAFSVVTGTLPAGLSLSAAGVLSGTPTTAGSFTFTIQARDASSCPSLISAFTIVVTTAVPTLPQYFAIALALTLIAVGYFSLRQRQHAPR